MTKPRIFVTRMHPGKGPGNGASLAADRVEVWPDPLPPAYDGCCKKHRA